EARHWNSHDRGSGFIFFTADKEQAEWFATLAHISGRSASIRREEQNEGSYSNTVMWWVNVKSRDYVQIKRKHWKAIEYEGYVYCPQVPSTFWLVRDNGYISVTGNTNLQNVTAELRKIFISDPGYKLIGIDLEQAESREVGWLCGVLFDEWSYLDAAYSGDLHTTVTKLVWKNLPWTSDPKANKAIAEQIYYRTYSYRDMSKKLGHGSNYYGTPPTMARHAKIKVQMAADFQKEYFEAFPGIPRWHRYVAQQLQQNQLIITPFGRRRHFFGRPNDDATLRECIAFGPQSATGDRMNLALYRIWRDLRALGVQLIAQVHDAVYFQIPEHLDEQEIITQALHLIESITFEHKGRTLLVPGEAKSGWNWGNWDEKTNPNGLKKVKGKDTRVRLEGLERIL
ncbi:MAG: DNA polymerase, partial [Sulfurovaceae bacterium]|nr:DNA polymerase [Sulfurovaceae bacterium]